MRLAELTAVPLSGKPELGSCYPHAELWEC